MVMTMTLTMIMVDLSCLEWGYELLFGIIIDVVLVL